MKYLFALLAFLVFSVPTSVYAADNLRAVKIIKVESIAQKSAIVPFSRPELAGKRVKVYAELRWKAEPYAESIEGWHSKEQQFFITMDKNGNGAVNLKKLIRNESYSVSLIVKRLEPSVQYSDQSRWVKFRTLR